MQPRQKVRNVISLILLDESYIYSLNTCYELFGFDVLLDEEYHPWLMEVNISPSLHCSSPLDLKVKKDLVKDVANTVGYTLNLFYARSAFAATQRKIIGNVGKGLKSHYRKAHLPFNAMMNLATDSVSYGGTNGETMSNGNVPFPKRTLDSSSVIAATSICKTLTEQEVRILKTFEEEQCRCGSFKMLYPCEQYSKSEAYQPFFGTILPENRLLEWWAQFPAEKRIDWLKNWKPSNTVFPSSSFQKSPLTNPNPNYPQVTSSQSAAKVSSKASAIQSRAPVLKPRKQPVPKQLSRAILPKTYSSIDIKDSGVKPIVSRASSARLARPPQHPRNYPVPSKASEIISGLMIIKSPEKKANQVAAAAASSSSFALKPEIYDSNVHNNDDDDDFFIENYLRQSGFASSRYGSASTIRRPSSSSTVESRTRKFISQRTILESYISRNLPVFRQSVNKVNLSAPVKLSHGTSIPAIRNTESTQRLNEALSRTVATKSNWPSNAKKELSQALYKSRSDEKTNSQVPRFHDSISQYKWK